MSTGTTMESNFPWQYRWIPSRREDSDMSLATSDFLLHLCLPLKTDTTFPKWGKAILAAWSLMYSGRLIVTKIGSFPFMRGSICSQKLSFISESPKRYWISAPWSFSFAVFDLKIRINFEGETFYRAPISFTSSGSRIRKISDSRIFFWIFSEHSKCPNNDLSLTWAEWNSSRDLCQTSPVRELFKPVEFGSRSSSGVELHSSSKGRKKLNIPSFSGCLVVTSLGFFVGLLVFDLNIHLQLNGREIWLNYCLRFRVDVDFHFVVVWLSFVVESRLNRLSGLLRSQCWIYVP